MSDLGAEVSLAELEGGDPYPALDRLRADEPVAWLPALGAWLVTRHDLALGVLRDPRTFTVDDPRFSTARVVGPSMLSLDGAEHTRHRKPFSPAFRPAEIEARFAPFVRAEAARLVRALLPAGTAELRRGLAGPLSVAVVAEALGLDDTDTDGDTDTVLSWYDAIVGAVADITAGREPAPAGAAAFDDLRAHVEATLVRHRSSSLLVAAADEDHRLRTREVVSNAAVLMFGGIETTEGMIANAVLHLLRDVDQLALVRARPDLLPAAVEESLRLEPAAAMVDRYATRDVELGGAAIRRGDQVTVSITATNRDPAVFAEPAAFRVERPDARRHLAFAHGPHFCLGMDLARLETRIALRTLLDAMPALRLDAGAVPQVRGVVFRKPRELRVRWDQRPGGGAGGVDR